MCAGHGSVRRAQRSVDWESAAAAACALRKSRTDVGKIDPVEMKVEVEAEIEMEVKVKVEEMALSSMYTQ